MADMINTTAPKTRERWLDVLKLLAAYLIVVIHSAGNGIMQARRSEETGLPGC